MKLTFITRFSLALLLALTALAALAAPGWAAAFSGGDGLQATPYEISSKADLEALRDAVNGGTTYENMYFKLTADIDLGGTDWTPIGDANNPFKGNFDGDGKKITGLRVNVTTSHCAGLFGYVQGGAISNLAVSGNVALTYDNDAMVGGIVGSLFNGNISNCSFTGGCV